MNCLFSLYAITGFLGIELKMESVSNVNGTLSHYKSSIRGIVQDYIITFNSEECDNVMCSREDL